MSMDFSNLNWSLNWYIYMIFISVLCYIKIKSSEVWCFVTHYLSATLSKQLVIIVYIYQRKIGPPLFTNAHTRTHNFISFFTEFCGFDVNFLHVLCLFVFKMLCERSNNNLNWQENIITQSVEKNVKHVSGKIWKKIAFWKYVILLERNP